MWYKVYRKRYKYEKIYAEIIWWCPGKIKIYGAVLIIGHKLCGKSTIAKQYAKSVLKFQNPRTRENNLEIANIRPVFFLEGENPRLIDEWHASMIWAVIKYDIDNKGLYIFNRFCNT